MTNASNQSEEQRVEAERRLKAIQETKIKDKDLWFEEELVPVEPSENTVDYKDQPTAGMEMINQRIANY